MSTDQGPNGVRTETDPSQNFITGRLFNNERKPMDIEKATLENSNFRKVLHTGRYLQVVVMALQAGEDIGLEAHAETDRFIRVESGKVVAVVGNESYDLESGVAVVIPAGIQHNVVNTSDEPLRIYTIYAPPEHPDGTIHRTKADAIAYADSRANR